MSTPLETLTFRQAAERYPAFSEAALRWLRFNGGENGFDICVIKLGRRVLLDPEAFERWLASHKVSGASTTEAAEKFGPQFGSTKNGSSPVTTPSSRAILAIGTKEVSK